jgi:hypothetical protein
MSLKIPARHFSQVRKWAMAGWLFSRAAARPCGGRLPIGASYSRKRITRKSDPLAGVSLH